VSAEVETVSVEVPAAVPLTTTGFVLKEHVGTWLPPLIFPQERLTMPV
jgi:hypothetical protein